MTFNSSSEQTLEGLKCADTVVYLRKAIKNYFKLVLVNNSNHDIFLRKNTVLGHLDYVSSVIPLEVKNVEMLQIKYQERILSLPTSSPVTWNNPKNYLRTPAS